MNRGTAVMKLYTTLFLVLFIGTASAFNPLKIKLKPIKEPVQFYMGVHTGIDIGGAVPYPLDAVLGVGNKMGIVPRLAPSLGISYSLVIDKRWSVSVESTYKKVEMAAKTRLTKESIREGENTLYFEGRADAHMSFSMIELPLYAKYSFGNGMNKLLLGGYYAYILDAEFITTPVQGMAGDNEDKSTWEPFGPGDMEQQNFTDKLGSWDAGIVVGYERVLIDRVTIGGRFAMGFKDIFRSGEENKYLSYSMLNMRGTVMLSYTILRK